MTPFLFALRAVADEAGGPASPFEVEFGLFFWTWLVFIVLFLLLRKFAWPAILKTTEEREQAIARQLAEAERLHAEARTAREEQQRLLAEATTRAQGLLADAKAMADKERALAVQQTKDEQDQLLARARREIAAERDRALVELRREAVDLSLAAATKLVGERMDSAADRQLVEQFIETLGPKA